MIVDLSTEEKNPQGQPSPPVGEHFLSSLWYTDAIFMLQHLYAPRGMDRTREKFLKKKESRFCILDGKLYWKELGGVLMNCVEEKEEKRLIKEFHVG